jgi:hypothetical protein
MKNIDIFYLTHRRHEFLITHAREISKILKFNPNIRSVNFLANTNNISDNIKKDIKNLLGDRVYFETHYNPISYMEKLHRISNSNADYVVKIDEDCYMTSDSWLKMTESVNYLESDDLFITGCITNGIPTCDLFLKYHAPNIKNYIEKNYFCNTTFIPMNGADYTPLNHPSLKIEWNPSHFWELVSNINHYFKGMHPMRMRFDANKILNDYILENFKECMHAKDLPILRKNIKEYPHYCPQFLLMNPKKLYEVLNFNFFNNFNPVPPIVDDEMLLNAYRNKYNLNMVIIPGCPILHTMFNWSGEFNYEEDLIKKIGKITQ